MKETVVKTRKRSKVDSRELRDRKDTTNTDARVDTVASVQDVSTWGYLPGHATGHQ